MAGIIGAWTRATVVGELLGFLAPTAVGVAFFLALGDPDGPAAWLAPVAAAFGGAGEGAVLGWFQGTVLGRTGIATRRSWTFATMWGAVIAWACGMSAPLLGQAGSGPLPGMAAALLGLVGLASLAVFQWRLLRDLPHARWWIPGSMAAWAVGVALVIAAMAVVPDGSPWWAWAFAGMVGAVAMAAVVGVGTGWMLNWMLPEPPSDSEST